MKHSLFAIQLLMPLGGSVRHELLQRDLHKLLRVAPERPTYVDKARFYGDLARIVRRAEPEVPRGVWDYTNDPDEAEREWTEWTDGTVRDFAGPRQAPSPGAPLHMFLTVALLLERKSKTDRTLEQRCALPDEALWRRSTFHMLLDAVPSIDFQRVQSDAVFLCPGDLGHGLSQAELASETYAYLRALSPD